MRLITIVAVFALTASPAFACGPGGTSRAASQPVLKHIKKAEPSKAEPERRATAAKAAEARMIKQGYMNVFALCGRGSFVWVKKDLMKVKRAT
jgi:hypothetical protein